MDLDEIRGASKAEIAAQLKKRHRRGRAKRNKVRR